MVGFDTVLKQPADLLAEAIRAYAAGTEAPPLLVSFVDRILRGDRSLDQEVSRIVADVNAIKADARSAWAQARKQTLTELKWDDNSLEERRKMAFKDLYAAEHWAEALAEHLGLADACRRRGLEGLLAVRPVQICVGAAMSLVFAQVVGDGVQSREPKRGDAYDLWHALLASVAGVFVTGDERLAEQLSRVPVDDFRVVTSLRARLDDPRIAHSR